MRFCNNARGQRTDHASVSRDDAISGQHSGCDHVRRHFDSDSGSGIDHRCAKSSPGRRNGWQDNRHLEHERWQQCTSVCESRRRHGIALRLRAPGLAGSRLDQNRIHLRIPALQRDGSLRHGEQRHRDPSALNRRAISTGMFDSVPPMAGADRGGGRLPRPCGTALSSDPGTGLSGCGARSPAPLIRIFFAERRCE